MKVLETERLVLRRVQTTDAPLLLELLNDPAFIEHVADRSVRTEAEAERYIAEKMLPSFEQFGFGFYVPELKESGTGVGICGLIKRETLDDVDVGFATRREFWRSGYTYEAARAVMDYGLTTLGLPRIVAITGPGNTSSMKLLEKLGLRLQRVIQLPGYPQASNLFA